LKFRFADRIDLILMFASMCGNIVVSLCLVFSIVLFGRVTGLFAIESFANNCAQQQQNSMDTIRSNITCPLGIELNPDNFLHLYK
jgi:hypothetical protein